ncbi:MAG: VCBS repeat-containing protein [Bacteroidetes bacterium]|nr:VCBS repeat-containing protein [Bacteroidota bacterium]
MKYFLSTFFAVIIFNTTFSQVAPTITSFTPTSGAPGTTVVLTGTNFVNVAANIHVYFGAAKATVSASTTTSCTVTVPSGASFGPISVTKPATSYTSYSTAFFNPTQNCPDAIEQTSFDTTSFATLNIAPYYINYGDIDLDGKPDMIVSERAGSTTSYITIYRNTSATNGAITFATGVPYAVGSNIRNLAIGDLNADGKLDIACLNRTAGTVSILINASTVGTITFNTPLAYLVSSGPGGSGIAIGDLNKDGKPDIAVATGITTASDSIAVLQNLNTTSGAAFNAGSFASYVNYYSGNAIEGLCMGDIDGDGFDDIVCSNNNNNNISVFRNTSIAGGAISFAAKVTSGTGINPLNISLGDVNADGKLDIAVANNATSGGISIIQNNSTPGVISLATDVIFSTGANNNGRDADITDINGDGKLDVIVAVGNADTVSVFININGTGTINSSFFSLVNYALPVSFAPRDVAAQDLNADGKTDFTTVSQVMDRITIFRNLVNGGPYMTSASSATICSGNAVGLAFTATPSPTTYSWLTTANSSVATESTTAQTATSLTNTLTINSGIITPVVLNYTVTPSSTTCPGGVPHPQTVTVTVNPKPIITAMTNTVCSGTAFTSTPINTTNGTVPAGTTYSWSAPTVTGAMTGGAAGTNAASITGTLTNTTTVAQTATYTITPSANSCSGNTFTLTVTVNPTPVMTSATSTSVCSETALNFALTSGAASTYSWLTSTNANVSGETTTATVGSILNNTLVSSLTTATTVVYTITPTGTAGSCVGNAQTVTVTVNPKPVMTSATSTSVCSGTALSFPLTSGAVSTFSWLTSINSNVTGETTTATVGSTLNNTLASSLTTATTVVYTVTPTGTAGSCVGTAQTITVTVNPKPVMTSATSTSVCSGTALNFALTSGVASTYSWLTSANTNVTGETTTATVGSTLNNTLVSSLTTATTLVYTITPTSTTGNCAGTAQTLTVTVNPLPVMTSSTSTSVCSDVALNFSLTSGAAASYSWLTTNNANTTGESTTAQIFSSINNTLTSTAITATTLIYTVTPTGTAGSCVGAAQTVTVTVNPKPVMTSATSTSVCSDAALSFPLTSGAASTYSWLTSANANVTGETTTATVGSTLNNTLVSSLTTATTVVYTITPTGTAGSCVGTAQTVTVTVNPKPVMTSATSTSVCSATALSFPLTSGAASTYSWLTSANANVSGETTTATVGSTLNNTLVSSLTTATTVVYTITPTGTSGSCVGAAQTVTVTVNPKPIMTSATTYSVCSGVAMSFPLTSGAAATYSWLTSDNVNTTGESVLPQSGSTLNNTINHTLTTAPILVYTVTPTGTAGACVGNAQNVTVTVNPKATMTSATTKTICSGSSVALGLTSNLTSTYQWVAASNANVGGESITTQSGATINNVLTNTLTAAQNITYTVTPTTSLGCVSNTQTVTITIDPQPTTAAAGPDQTACTSTALLNGNLPTVGTGVWTQVSGPAASITNANLYNTTISALINTNTVVMQWTISNGVCSNSTDQISVTYNTAAVECLINSDFFADNSDPCLNAPVIFTDNSLGASTYSWNFGAGATPPTANTAGPHSVTYSSAGAKNVSLFITGSNGSDTETKSAYINVVPTPSAAGAIGGLFTLCAGTTQVLYSVSPISNATSYNWTLPSGATINTGAGTNSISVNFANNATSGNISVVGVNACGSGTISTSSITVNPLAANPSVISGLTTVCQTLGSTAITYSINPIVGATTYNWTYPAGATPTITSNTLTLVYGTSAVSGDITVYGSNVACGASLTTSTLSIVVNPLPSAAGSINGPATICQGATGNYSIDALTNATSYTWTLPSGGSTSSNSNSALVNFSTTASNGNITVAGTNTCGNGPSSTLSLTLDLLHFAPGSITGPATVCANSTGHNYSISAITNANSYNWVFPSGANSVNPNNIANTYFDANANSGLISVNGINTCGSGAAGTYSVTVSPLPDAAGVLTGPDTVCQGQTSVVYSINPVNNATNYVWFTPNGSTGTGTNSFSVDFSASAISGNIKVYGNNACGNGDSTTIPIHLNPLPSPPVFSGSAMLAPCPLADSMLFNFSTALYAESFNWILPAGAYANGATNNDSINIGFNSVGINDTLKVASVNGCGNSAYSYMVLNLQALTTPYICMVSVDTLSNYNEIYWNKTGFMSSDTFLVYRDTANYNYALIGKVPYDSLSIFNDTLRSLYAANGNPNVSSWRYKIAVEDSCGNISAMSPYHQTMFIQDNFGNFSWNHYQIEGETTPVPVLNSYEISRDDFATGAVNVIQTLSASSNAYTDVDYLTYQSTADWRVFTNWTISCEPTLRLSNDNNGIQTTVVKSKSNIKNNRTIGITSAGLKNSFTKIYPNPASTMLTVELQALNGEQAQIAIKNMLGQSVYLTKTNQAKNDIKVDELNAGVYFVEVTINKQVEIIKLVIEK